MVILLALIATAIGGTMLIMSNSDHMISANERDAERALFASRAGLNYAFYLYREGLIAPTGGGTSFDSFSASVGNPLDGADFTGQIYDLSTILSRGQLYRIESTGVYNKASRTTELIFQIIPDVFKYGYMAFSEATLHNHSGLAGPSFKIQSTILSNGNVGIPDSITIDGAIVSSGEVEVGSGSTVTKDIFANAVKNGGTVQGKVRLLTAVDELPSAALSWDRVDARGTKYDWFNGNNSPGSLSGNAPLGGTSSYTIQNGDEFKANLFTRNGTLMSDPDVNVTKYVAPPVVDYLGMKAEADRNDPTYFASTTEAVAYMITKKVTETIGGKTVTTVRIGTPDKPEFLYIDGDLKLTLDPTGSDSPGSAEIQADGLYIEGGIYVTGSFDFDGPDYIAAVPPYPMPPDYYMLSINALPYCYPALLAYEEPSVGTIDDFDPADTPAVGGGSAIDMKGGSEGPSFFNGVVFAQGDIHLHHTSDPRELIRFNGAELASKLHNCDFFWFSYDPAIRCTRFFFTDAGTPEVISFREIR
jgi:hypothetical protein